MSDSIHHFLHHLASSNLTQQGPVEKSGCFEVAWLDFRRLKLGLNNRVPFVWLSEPAQDGRDLQQRLLTFSREIASRSPTIFLCDDGDLERNLTPSVLRQHAVAPLSPQVRSSFIAARDPERRYQIFGTALAQGIGVAALSPYSPGKPASGSRFFGRSKIIDSIVSGKTIRNCTIVGNRRIGKTSLLHEVKERLSDVFVPGKTVHFAQIYASKAESTWDLVYLVLSQLGIPIPTKWTKFGAIAPRFIARFPQLVHDFARRQDTQVVILIDEFDSFLERDTTRKWECLHLLREVAGEEGLCAVIVAGFRLLMYVRAQNDNPYTTLPGRYHSSPSPKRRLWRWSKFLLPGSD